MIKSTAIIIVKVLINIKTKKVRDEIIINEFENLNTMIDNVRSMDIFINHMPTQKELEQLEKAKSYILKKFKFFNFNKL